MEGNREREKSYNQTDSYQTEMQKEKMKIYLKTEIRAPLNLCKYKICIWDSTAKTTKFSENY